MRASVKIMFDANKILKKAIPTFVCLFIAINLLSQPNKRTNHWYFSTHIGLNFNNGSPIEDTLSPVAGTRGSCSIMSDTNGNLLFYSDGRWVWNKDHQVMSNGYSGNSFIPGTQASICIPKPLSLSLYYVFTSRSFEDENPMFYYTVNMEANNGIGAVIDKDTLEAGWDAAEQLTAVYHKNKKDVWIITRKYREHKYASFLVNELGVDINPVLSPAPDRYSLNDLNWGFMKVSYSKKYLISCYSGGTLSKAAVEVCRFNVETGYIDHLYTFKLRDIIPNNPSYRTYNCEFSPCSKYLYLAGELRQDSISHIYQFDIGKIEDSIQFTQSAIKIGEGQGTNIQLASNGKIYCFALTPGLSYPLNNYIGTINNPERPGIDCYYQPNALYLNHGEIHRSCVNLVIDFLHRFDFDGICESDTFAFDPWFFPEPDLIQWNFGDPLSGTNNTSTIPHAKHKFTDGGTYEVSVHVEYPGGRIEETSREVEVVYAPEPDLGPDTIFCSTEGIVLDAECGPHLYTWSTGAFGVSQITAYDTGWYWVRVENDAGCFEIDSIHLASYPPAVADTTDLEVIPTTCGGSTGVIRGLQFSGSPPFSYTWTNDMGDTVATSLSIFHLPVGNYTLGVTDGNGCPTPFGPYTIHDAGDVLIESVGYSNEHCSQLDAGITVTATSGLTDMLFYSLDNGNTYFNNQGLFTGLSAGTYAVRVKDSTDCQDVYTYNPIIIQNINGPEITNISIGPCASGQSNGFIEIAALGGGDTIYYSNDNGLSFQVNNGGFYNLVHGYYTCLVMDEASCDTSFIVEVPEEITIHLQAIAGEDEVCPGNAAFVPLTVSNFNDVAYFKTTLIYDHSKLTCTGFANAHISLQDSLQVMLFPAEGKAELTWYSAPVTLPDNTKIADLVFQSLDPGLSMVIWDGSAAASLFLNSSGLTIPVDYFLGSVRIYEEVFFTLSPDKEPCQGENLEVVPMLGSSNGEVSYYWTGPAGFTHNSDTLSVSNIQQGQSGTYSLRLTDTLGCHADDSFEVLVHPTPVPAFSAQDTIITASPVEIDAGQGFASYLWNTGETSRFITAVHEGWYGVLIASLQGCYGQDSVFVLFNESINENIYLPNAFSPNGDGLNDEFRAIGEPDNLTSFSMKIFNRWGVLVFESQNISQGWDGSYKSDPAPSGAYVYKIEYAIGTSQEEPGIITGILVLIR